MLLALRSLWETSSSGIIISGGIRPRKKPIPLGPGPKPVWEIEEEIFETEQKDIEELLAMLTSEL